MIESLSNIDYQTIPDNINTYTLLINKTSNYYLGGSLIRLFNTAITQMKNNGDDIQILNYYIKQEVLK